MGQWIGNPGEEGSYYDTGLYGEGQISAIPYSNIPRLPQTNVPWYTYEGIPSGEGVDPSLPIYLQQTGYQPPAQPQGWTGGNGIGYWTNPATGAQEAVIHHGGGYFPGPTIFGYTPAGWQAAKSAHPDARIATEADFKTLNTPDSGDWFGDTVDRFIPDNLGGAAMLFASLFNPWTAAGLEGAFGGSSAAAAGGGDLGLFNAGVGGSGAIGGSGAAAAGAGLGGSMDWGDALSQGWDLGSGAGNYAPVEDLSRWYDASTQAFIPDAGNVFASITKNPGLADLLFGGASGGLSSIAKGIGGLFGGGAQAGGLGSLFGGSGGGLNFGNLAAGSIPVLAAIDYARGQKPFDTSRLEDLYGRYNPNAQAYEYDQNTGLGRSALTSSLQQRGVMGSSFGDQSLTNFNTSRDLGRQSLLNQGIGGQAGIAGQILNANVASQANKNQLYGSALNALGNIFSTKPNFTLGY